MALLLQLNRRHKAALFVTLVVAGVMLLAGAGLKEAVGVVLLGLAFCLAIGSDLAVRAFSNPSSYIVGLVALGTVLLVATIADYLRAHIAPFPPVWRVWLEDLPSTVPPLLLGLLLLGLGLHLAKGAKSGAKPRDG